jgi:hypothetical protein
MQFNGGGRRSAAVLLLCTLTSGLSAAVCATAEEAAGATRTSHRAEGYPYGMDPVQLGAVSAESRALFVDVLGRMETMRREMDGLRADKVALAERVTRLEEKDCDETLAAAAEEEPKQEKDQSTERTADMGANSTHRRAQAGQACERVRDFQALSAAAMDACCPPNGAGHRRFLQASCDLPTVCPSAACAAVFVPYMTDCGAMLAATPGVPLVDFESLVASCAEMQTGARELLQPVAVQMFRVLVNTEGTAHAGSMFAGSDGQGEGDGHGHPVDPLQPATPIPPAPPDGMGGADETAVAQYHAVCTSANVVSCVPDCNMEHHGYALLATIDGTDTKFSCNVAHGLFSWMGAASDGGYLGADSASFFSAVVSGAAGAYLLTLTADAGFSTNLSIQPAQDVSINGDPGLALVPSWGSGGFTVQERALLSLTHVRIAGPIVVTPQATSFALLDCEIGTLLVPPIEELVSIWYSASVPGIDGNMMTNSNGNPFVLFLLPAQPPGSFAGANGPQSYAQLCNDMGLRTVVSGDSCGGFGPCSNYCSQYNCMPLPDDTRGNGALWLGTRRYQHAEGTPIGQAWEDRTWNRFVLHNTAAGGSLQSFQDGRTCGDVSQRTHDPSCPSVALRPVCGLEIGVEGFDPDGITGITPLQCCSTFAIDSQGLGCAWYCAGTCHPVGNCGPGCGGGTAFCDQANVGWDDNCERGC